MMHINIIPSYSCQALNASGFLDIDNPSRDAAIRNKNKTLQRTGNCFIFNLFSYTYTNDTKTFDVKQVKAFYVNVK